MGILGDEVLDCSFVGAAAERALLHGVRELAPGFARRAAEHDRSGTFPAENFRELRAAGMLGMLIPQRYGGRGVSSPGYIAALYEMAKGDASTALAYNMHATTLAVIALLGDEAQKRRWFGRVLDDGACIAALGSETSLKPFLTGDKPRTTLQRRGGELVLNGRKSYGSFGPNAQLLYVSATYGDRVVGAMVGSGQPGVEAHDDWDVMSMRSTSSVTMDFHDVVVDPADVVAPPDHRLALLLELEYALGYPSVYLGAAEVAYRSARAAAKDALDRLAGGGELGFEPDAARTVAEIGRMRLLLESSWLMARHAATAGPIGSFPRGAAIASAKAVACEAACDVAALAIRVAGGRALSRRSPIERAFRDVQAGLVMAFAPDQVRSMIGLLELDRAPGFVGALLGEPLPASGG